jgi:hypothetical protein
VSRRFVAATERALDDMMHADLSSLDIVALMVDGVHFADHLCVVALGIGIDGTKHPLGVVEGSTENATVVRSLLTNIRDRGLDVTRPVLVVIDGAKALHAAVREVFDRPLVQRCQLHKVRNVERHLNDATAATGREEDAPRTTIRTRSPRRPPSKHSRRHSTRRTPARRRRCVKDSRRP